MSTNDSFSINANAPTGGMANLLNTIGAPAAFGQSYKETVSDFMERIKLPLETYNKANRMDVRAHVVNESEGIGLPCVVLYCLVGPKEKTNLYMFSYLFEGFLSDEPFKPRQVYQDGAAVEEERLKTSTYSDFLVKKLSKSVIEFETRNNRIVGRASARPTGFILVSGKHSFKEDNAEGCAVLGTYVNEGIGAIAVASNVAQLPTAEMLKASGVTINNKVTWCPGDTGIDDNGKPFARDFKILVSLQEHNPKGDMIHGGAQTVELIEVSGQVDFIFAPGQKPVAAPMMMGQLLTTPGYVTRIGITNLSRPARNNQRITSGITNLMLAIASVTTVAANNEFLQFASVATSTKANMGNLENGWNVEHGCVPQKAVAKGKRLNVAGRINQYAQQEENTLDPLTAYNQFCQPGVIITFDMRLGGVNHWFEENLLNMANAHSNADPRITKRAAASHAEFTNAVDNFIGSNAFSASWGNKPYVVASPILLPDATYMVDSDLRDIRSYETLTFLEANGNSADFSAFMKGQLPGATKQEENELRRLYKNAALRYDETGNICRNVLNHELPSAIMEAMRNAGVIPTFSGLMSTNIEHGVAQFGGGAFGVVTANNLVNTIYNNNGNAMGGNVPFNGVNPSYNL